jgi:hypothetical protein
LGLGDGTLEDWERGVFDLGLPTVGKDELPCEMVKSGSKIMDGIANDDTKTSSGLLDKLDPKNAISAMRMIVGDNSIVVTLKEGAALRMEITDVLFGPFDLGVNACDAINRHCVMFRRKRVG